MSPKDEHIEAELPWKPPVEEGIRADQPIIPASVGCSTRVRDGRAGIGSALFGCAFACLLWCILVAVIRVEVEPKVLFPPPVPRLEDRYRPLPEPRLRNGGYLTVSVLTAQVRVREYPAGYDEAAARVQRSWLFGIIAALEIALCVVTGLRLGLRSERRLRRNHAGTRDFRSGISASALGWVCACLLWCVLVVAVRVEVEPNPRFWSPARRYITVGGVTRIEEPPRPPPPQGLENGGHLVVQIFGVGVVRVCEYPAGYDEAAARVQRWCIVGMVLVVEITLAAVVGVRIKRMRQESLRHKL